MASSSRDGAGVFGYLKSAFLQHWNMLFFLGASAAALISPMPDVLFPLIGAAEIAYLTAMVGNPRFRRAIDARASGRSDSLDDVPGGSVPQQTLTQLIADLSDRARKRFEQLRRRCLEMQSIAKGVGGSAHRRKRAVDDMHHPALDRLLWVFLRLLYSQTSLRQFLTATDEDEIANRIDATREKLVGAKDSGDERVVRALTDSLATAELRLDNYRRARSNAEFVDVELDRLEGKIQALSEMAVNRQDPDFISREVDSVAASMHQTEAAMSELKLVDGLIDDLAEPPAILDADLERALEQER